MAETPPSDISLFLTYCYNAIVLAMLLKWLFPKLKEWVKVG